MTGSSRCWTAGSPAAAGAAWAAGRLVAVGPAFVPGQLRAALRRGRRGLTSRGPRRSSSRRCLRRCLRRCGLFAAAFAGAVAAFAGPSHGALRAAGGFAAPLAAARRGLPVRARRRVGPGARAGRRPARDALRSKGTAGTRAGRAGSRGGDSSTDARRRAVNRSARPRVGGRPDLAQPVDGHQRVDLRRRHRGVAEQLLDDADVGPAVEQVRGEASAAACAATTSRRARPGRRPTRSTVQALCRDSRPPRALSSSAGRAAARRGQRRTGPHEVGLDGPRGVSCRPGTIRCLPPLPSSRTSPSARSRSSTSRPTASRCARPCRTAARAAHGPAARARALVRRGRAAPRPARR